MDRTPCLSRSELTRLSENVLRGVRPCLRKNANVHFDINHAGLIWGWNFLEATFLIRSIAPIFDMLAEQIKPP